MKWLYEISHSNPLWISTTDARQYGIKTGDLVKLRTRIGYFVTRAWVTEGIRPGRARHVASPRPLAPEGRDRRRAQRDRAGVDRRATAARGRYRMRQEHGARPFASNDPDSQRIWWNEIGVHQNLTFPVQPDPVSGMHCWHQRVRLERAGPDDRYGDIEVDTEKAHEAYKEWMQRTRPAPGPDGSRRPSWFDRPLRPVPAAYRMPSRRRDMKYRGSARAGLGHLGPGRRLRRRRGRGLDDRRRHSAAARRARPGGHGLDRDDHPRVAGHPAAEDAGAAHPRLRAQPPGNARRDRAAPDAERDARDHRALGRRHARVPGARVADRPPRARAIASGSRCSPRTARSSRPTPRGCRRKSGARGRAPRSCSRSSRRSSAASSARARR